MLELKQLDYLDMTVIRLLKGARLAKVKLRVSLLDSETVDAIDLHQLLTEVVINDMEP